MIDLNEAATNLAEFTTISTRLSGRRPTEAQANQSSALKPSTRVNSLRFPVMMTSPLLRAWLAINRS